MLPRGGTIGDLLRWNGSGWAAVVQPSIVHFHAIGVNSTGAWANMPAAATLFGGGNMGGFGPIDLTGYTQVRFSCWMGSVAAVGGATLALKYNTAGGTTAANYSTMGSSALSLAIDVTNTQLTTGWIDLVAGARIASCYVSPIGAGGDGVVDPRFGFCFAEFR